jgi:hypothetical protein
MATEFGRTDYAHSEERVAKAIEDQTAKRKRELCKTSQCPAIGATVSQRSTRHESPHRRSSGSSPDCVCFSLGWKWDGSLAARVYLRTAARTSRSR